MTRGGGGIEIMLVRGLSAALLETVHGFVEAAVAEGVIPADACNILAEEFAVVARTNDDAVVGVLVFYPAEPGELFVHLAYIAPPRRRQGIYERMHDTLLRHAQCVGARTISAMTAPDNGPMNLCLQKIGHKVVAVYHRMDVGPV